MGTLQENQSLNAEYERNKKEREMQESIEYLNFCNEQLEKSNKNLNYKIEKLEEDYKTTCDQKNKYINSLEQGLNNAEQEIERLKTTIKEVRDYIKENKIYAELVDYEKNGEYYIDEIGLLEILDKVGVDKE